MAIDYKKARERIVLAFTKGLIKTYGLRRKEKREVECEMPGATYWDKDQKYMDALGVQRTGCFKRLPSKMIKQTVEIPQGVVPKEVLQYSTAVADAFVEVLRIAEENGLGIPGEQTTEVLSKVKQCR